MSSPFFNESELRQEECMRLREILLQPSGMFPDWLLGGSLPEATGAHEQILSSPGAPAPVMLTLTSLCTHPQSSQNWDPLCPQEPDPGRWARRSKGFAEGESRISTSNCHTFLLHLVPTHWPQLRLSSNHPSAYSPFTADSDKVLGKPGDVF